MSVNPPTIEVIISPTGQTRIATHGYSASSCKDATRQLEQALGLVQSDLPTAEMHQVAPASQTQSEQR